MMTPYTLEKFANDLPGGGHIKTWKAISIFHTLGDIPDIASDSDRLFKYIKNCLNMEGFSDDKCKLIANWIKNHENL